MQEYEQGQPIKVTTYVYTERPLGGKLEYTFAREDEPGEKITLTYKPPIGPSGRVEVPLGEEIPYGQTPGVYRLESLKVYDLFDKNFVEADIEEIKSSAEFRVKEFRLPQPVARGPWEFRS